MAIVSEWQYVNNELNTIRAELFMLNIMKPWAISEIYSKVKREKSLHKRLIQIELEMSN